MSPEENVIAEVPAGGVSYTLALIGVLTLVFAPTVLILVLNLVQGK